MKVYKGISLSDQKAMFENLFIWDLENGEKPDKKEYREWILEFFMNKDAISAYIKDMKHDIENSKYDLLFSDINESYERQILFLQTLLK